MWLKPSGFLSALREKVWLRPQRLSGRTGEKGVGETITEGRGSSLLGAGLEFGILSVLASSDFSKIDLVRSPPSLALPYPPKVDYGKRIIGMARANKLQKSLFVVKEKGVTVNAVLVFQCVCHQ
jgi:hypothetical protein